MMLRHHLRLPNWAAGFAVLGYLAIPMNYVHGQDYPTSYAPRLSSVDDLASPAVNTTPTLRRFDELEGYVPSQAGPGTTPTDGPNTRTHSTYLLSASQDTHLASGDTWWRPLVAEKQRSTANHLGISLNSLLLSALTHSAQIQLASDDPLISETEITTADATFDWTAFLDARWDDLSEPVGSTLTTGGPERLRDHNATMELGVRRRNTIGGEFEIGQRFGHQNNNSIFFVPNNQGTTRLTLSYTQPLLRGAGRTYNTSVTVLAKLKTGISRSEFERQLQDHLLDITRGYWNLYFERGKLLQQQRLLERGMQILVELESREAVDALQSQIVRARSAVENRRAQLVRSRLAIKTAEARIRALVNDPALGDTLSMELVPKEELSEAPFLVELQSSVAQALQLRPEMSAAIKQIKSASVRMNMSKKETLPLLNVVLETYVSGLEGNSSVGGAFDEQFTEGEPSYGIGLQYEYPIWNRAATSKLQKRRLELRRLQHQFRSIMETLKLEVEVSVHEVNASFESLSAKRRAMEAAAAEVDYLKDRWQLLPVDNGSASLLLEDLLDAQDRLTESEESLLQSTLEYSLSQVGYKRAVGSLLTQNGIVIDRNCNCNLPAQEVLQINTPAAQAQSPAPEAIPTMQYEPPPAPQEAQPLKSVEVNRPPMTRFQMPIPSMTELTANESNSASDGQITSRLAVPALPIPLSGIQ